MEQEYLIGVTNKYLALIDTEDPYESLKNIENERQKKKTLKTAGNIENKENKSKTNDAATNKTTPRKPATKQSDRVLTADRNVKSDNQSERPGVRRNRDERAPVGERNSGNYREGGAPRGPRPDGQRGEKREGGPRPPRNDGEVRQFRGARQDGEFRGSRQDGEFRGSRQDGEFRGSRQDGEFRGSRQDGESRPYRGDRQQGGNDGESRPPRRERREFNDNPDLDGRPDRRPATRGRGGPRPPGRNYDNRGKREFDRKSGSDRTGVKSVDKREGAGSFNWDTDKDPEALISDLNVTNQSDETTDFDEPPKETESTERKEDESSDEAPAPPLEDEVKELTLDEYRALRGKRELPHYDIRKPGEGEDLTRWKNMVEIKKKLNDDHTDEELEIPDFPQRVGRQRHVKGIDITFNDNFRGGRGRGRGSGPGGDRRGGRGRGDGPQQRRFPREREERGGERDRGERERGPRQSAPKVNDEKDFPSLG